MAFLLKIFHSVLQAVCVNEEEKDITKNVFKFKNLMYYFFLLSNNYPNDKADKFIFKSIFIL